MEYGKINQVIQLDQTQEEKKATIVIMQILELG